MMIRVTPLVEPEPLMHLLAHLRDSDRAEITASRGGVHPVEMALEIGKMMAFPRSLAWLFWQENGDPVACLGAFAMTPTCAGCWAFGTKAWSEALPTVTRHVHRIMIPALLESGFHRAECRALSSREDTRRWLTGLGWKEEAVLSGFGIRREDFSLFAWLADESANRFRQPPQQGELPLRGGGRRAGANGAV